MSRGQLKDVLEKVWVAIYREFNFSCGIRQMPKMSYIPSSSMRRVAYSQVTLLIIATVCLALGLSLYVFGRPVDSTRFLPAALHIGVPWLDQLRPFFTNLPSLFHVYAFVLYSSAIVHPGTRNLILICITWFTIEITFELLQNPSLLKPGPLRDVLGEGVYDPMDILALILGTTAAYFSVRLITRRSQ